MARRETGSNKLRWALIGGLVVIIALADWYAGGIGPRVLMGSATLNLTSDPGEARVFLDGEMVGRTPLRDRSVPPGETVVRLQHRFHDPVSQSVSPGRGEVLDVHIEFPPSAGSLEVVTNPRGAEVMIDGEKLDDVSPVMLSAHPAGAYEITATIYGRELKTETVEVLPRQLTELSFDLERVAMSEIYLARSPGDVAVEIDGRPYKPGMTLPVGTYKVIAQRRGYAPLEKAVELVRGRSDHSVELVRLQGSLSVQVDPPDAVLEVSLPQGSEWRKVTYAEGMRIPTGPVRVRATALGHRSYERRLTIEAKPLRHAIRLEKYDVEPGRRFRDTLASGGEGPLLVVIGAGTFRMGSADGSSDERPVRSVEVVQPFAIGVYETTRGDYERLRELPEPQEPGASKSQLPATRVSPAGAQAYADWLSEHTGHRYRLPSEAEWEYVARGGSVDRYYFGSDAAMLCDHGNVADSEFGKVYPKPGVADCSDGSLREDVVGRFPANAFGVHDMIGNVEEWVADCWHDSYKGAPVDQRARNGDCSARTLRGGAWDSLPEEATVSYRSFSNRGSGTRGFRVVREL